MKTKINVTQFLRQYDSDNTRNSYRAGLRFFFESTYPEMKIKEDEKSKELKLKSNQRLPANFIVNLLDIYSIRYLDEDRDRRDDIMTFKESLRNKAPKTIRNRLNTIRVFLEDNKITFSKRFFKNMNGKKTEAVSNERVPSNEELRRIIEFLPLQGKTLALILSSSGMRADEAIKLEFSDLDETQDIIKIKIRVEVAKNEKKRITFMSPEAYLSFKEWKNFRDQYIKQANSRSFTHKREDTERVFPFSYHNFNRMWRIALEKAKLLEIDSRTNRITLRIHNLRKFFRLRIGRYGRDEAEALMGHQAGLNRIYANFDDAEERLKEVYAKSIPDLSIYQRGIQVSQDNEEMKNEIKELKDQVDYLRKKGYDNNEEIMFELNKVNKKLADVELEVQNWKFTVEGFNEVIDSYKQKMNKEMS